LGVPNLDGFVPAAASNLLSIGAPRHRKDPEIVRSQDTNQQKQRGKNLKKHTNSSAPSRNSQKLKEISRATVGPHRALAKVHFEIIYILMFFEHLFLKKSHIFKWPVSQILRKKHDCVVNFISY
jgi:hypothetical protein